jgi:fermentation-respiration switch protein FrsA (DUF1100 family)
MNRFTILFASFLAVFLTSCSVGNGYTPPDELPVIEPEEELPLYFEHHADSAFWQGPDFLARIIGGDNLILSLAFGGKLDDVRVDKILYSTLGAGGDTILASGIVAWPVSDSLKGVILAGHGSIGASRESPSEQMHDWMSLLALAGYMVVSPDYIGFGVSRELPHPYLHAGLTAGASLDMLFAVREYMEMRGAALNAEISVLGYSQGGAAALAIQKLAEEKYPNEVHIINVTAGGGPYDLTFLFDSLRDGSLSVSAFIPATIVGLDYGDGLRLDYSQFFAEPLLSKYNEWIVSKDFSLGEINDLLGSAFLAPALTENREDNAEVAKLRASLASNSLINWTPKAPLKLIHGTKDQTVPFACSQRAYDAFREKGCKVELRSVPSDHTGSIVYFILDLLEQFTK